MSYSPPIDVKTTNYKVIELDNLLEINKYYYLYRDKLLIFTLDNYIRKFIFKGNFF